MRKSRIKTKRMLCRIIHSIKDLYATAKYHQRLPEIILHIQPWMLTKYFIHLGMLKQVNIPKKKRRNVCIPEGFLHAGPYSVKEENNWQRKNPSVEIYCLTYYLPCQWVAPRESHPGIQGSLLHCCSFQQADSIEQHHSTSQQFDFSLWFRRTAKLIAIAT